MANAIQKAIDSFGSQEISGSTEEKNELACTKLLFSFLHFIVGYSKEPSARVVVVVRNRGRRFGWLK
jgi:hypothetical protein